MAPLRILMVHHKIPTVTRQKTLMVRRKILMERRKILTAHRQKTLMVHHHMALLAISQLQATTPLRHQRRCH